MFMFYFFMSFFVAIFSKFLFVLGISALIHSISYIKRSIYGNFGRRKNFKKLLGSDFVLITGCSTGSGLVLAQEMAKDGLNIIGTGHNDEIYKARDLCTKYGIEFIPVVADFKNRESVDKLIEIAKTKDVGAFYLNAGYPLFNNFFKFSEQQIADFMESMIVSQAILTHAFILQSRQRKSRTLIYLTASMAGQAPWPLGQLYCSSKAFFSSLGRHLANEMRIDSKIFVQAIHPSYFRNSNFMKKLPGHAGDLFQTLNSFYQTADEVGKILYKTALNSNAIDTSITSIGIRLLFWILTPFGEYYFARHIAANTPLD